MDFVVKIVDFKSWEIMREYHMNRQCINNWVRRFMLNIYTCTLVWKLKNHVAFLIITRCQQKVGCISSDICLPLVLSARNIQTTPSFKMELPVFLLPSVLVATWSVQQKHQSTYHQFHKMHEQVLRIDARKCSIYNSLHASLVRWSVTTLGSPYRNTWGV